MGVGGVRAGAADGDTEDDEAAINTLLTALGIDPDAVTYRGSVRRDEAQ